MIFGFYAKWRKARNPELDKGLYHVGRIFSRASESIGLPLAEQARIRVASSCMPRTRQESRPMHAYTHAVMPIYFLRYCCLVFWAAVPTSISWATFIIAIITIIAGAAIWLVLAFGIIVEATGLMAMLRSPEFFAILVGLVVLIRLFFRAILGLESRARSED